MRIPFIFCVILLLESCKNANNPPTAKVFEYPENIVTLRQKKLFIEGNYYVYLFNSLFHGRFIEQIKIKKPDFNLLSMGALSYIRERGDTTTFGCTMLENGYPIELNHLFHTMIFIKDTLRFAEYGDVVRTPTQQYFDTEDVEKKFAQYLIIRQHLVGGYFQSIMEERRKLQQLK